ncbi:sensor histidine kinase [Streptacidiphilus sp. MAP5-3]|uniref:sensor histidine kinase n=1 Tax=unclassified Streptacidiphilus TaxID=2643834 RepID=UPI003513E307
MSTLNAPAALAAAAAVVAVLLLLTLLVVQLRTRRARRRGQAARNAAMDKMRRAYDDLDRAYAQLQENNVRLVQELDDASEELHRSRTQGGEVLANLALRSLVLVERQLGNLEGLEERESDSVRLEQLYQLDHLATRMRRNSENMLLLAGGSDQQRPGRPGAPAQLLDVLRAALSEIERFERVHLTALPPVLVRGEVADDLSHVFAELLDNGTAFSPPTEAVTVTAWHLDSGEVMVSVGDRGIGMTDTMLRQVNRTLAEQGDGHEIGHGSGRSLGLRVVTLLARRLGLRIQLRTSASGDGTTALVALPAGLLADPAETHQQAVTGGMEHIPPGRPLPEDAHTQAATYRQGGPMLAAVPNARHGQGAGFSGGTTGGVGAAGSMGGSRSAGPAGTSAAPSTTTTSPNGLPKRVPGESGQVAQANEPSGEVGTRPPRDAGSAAEELRRRLGGFQNGLREAAAPREEDDKA